MTSTLIKPEPQSLTVPDTLPSRYNRRPTSWRLDVLIAVGAIHLMVLGLFLMVPAPAPLKSPDEPKPLHMVMVEPIEAPLVAPSGNAVQPSPQKSESQPLPVPVTQPHPVAVQKTATAVTKPASPVTKPSPATPAATPMPTTPVATTATGSEHAIALPSAASEGGTTNAKSASASSSSVAAPPPSSSAVGNSSSPPRFGVAYLNNPAPKYPSSARRMGEEGKVLLRVLVSADGLAKQVLLRTSSGSSALDDSAQAAVHKWRFIPAKLNGDTVEAWVQVPIVFKLDN